MNPVCLKCSARADSTHKSLKCELCKENFHVSCIAMNTKTYEVITKVKSVRWFCDQCENINIHDELKNLRDFKSLHAKLSTDMNTLAERLHTVEKSLRSRPIGSVRGSAEETVMTRSDVAAVLRS